MATIEMSTDLARMITSVLGIEKGGTGQNTANAGFNALGAGLTVLNADFADTTCIITTSTSGSTNDYYVRTYAKLKANIKSYLAPYIINSISISGSGGAISGASLSSEGVLTLTKGYTYTLPLATSSVRGGVKIGYTQSGKNYPVALSNEQMYVNVPWTDTDTKVTSAANHYTPSTVSGNDKTASATGATAAWSIDVVKGITINTDGKGHITGLSVTSGKIPANPNTNTTYTFAEGSTNGAFSVTPSGGSAQSVKIHGLGSRAYDSTAYIPLAGSTSITGNLVATKAGETYFAVKNSNTSCQVYLDSSGSYHGVYSNGYWDGSAFQSGGKWMIYRNTAGTIIVNGNCTGSADSATKDGSGNTITSHYVTLSTTQTISGAKTFSNHMYISAAKHIYMNYNSTNYNVLHNHNNGNVSLNAASGGLYIGYQNTTLMNWINGKMTLSSAGALETASTITAASSITASSGNITASNGNVVANASDTTARGCRATNSLASVATYAATSGNRGLYSHTDSKWICVVDADNTSYVTTGFSGFKKAVWNDFAEARAGETTKGGYSVYDDGTGYMRLCTKRLQPGARLTSDTFGFYVGESDECKTPIGVGGRVLTYPYQNRNNYHVGDAVCAAPNGTVDIMTREEIMMYPDRIIGIVSEIPNYEIWDNPTTYLNDETNTIQIEKANIKVDGRIWVYVR